MTVPLTIAIDGPGASGKNTVGVLLARRLGYRFIDTGAMYRALTWLALHKGLDFADEDGLITLAETTALRILPRTDDVSQSGIYSDSTDLSQYLHLPEVDATVSVLAQVPGVRTVMVNTQRQMAAEGGVVMAGRDIGTVVLPAANIKVYLDAPVEERARRRFQELRAGSVQVTFETVLDDLRQRDALDQRREASPLRPASDAHIISTEGLTPEQIVDMIIEHAPC